MTKGNTPKIDSGNQRSPHAFFPQHIAHICIISKQLLSDIFPIPFYNDSSIYFI